MELQSFLVVQLHLCIFLFMGDCTFPGMTPASCTPWCSHSVQGFYSFPWTRANFVINTINTVTSNKEMSWKVKYVHSTFLSINFGIPVLLLERSIPIPWEKSYIVVVPAGQSDNRQCLLDVGIMPPTASCWVIPEEMQNRDVEWK